VTDACATFEVVVQYPSSDMVNNNTGLTTQIPKQNNAGMTADPVGEPPLTLTGSINTDLLPPVFTLASTKTSADNGILPLGNRNYFTLGLNNNSTVPVDNFVAIDSIPPQFDLLYLRFSPVAGTQPVTINAYLNSTGTPVTWVSTNTGDSALDSLDVSGIPGFNPATDYVSAVEFDFGTVPSGFAQNVHLIVTPAYDAMAQDNLGNPVQLDSAYENCVEIRAIRPLDGAVLGPDISCASMCIVDTLARLAPAKTQTSTNQNPPPGSSTTGNPYLPGSQVTYTLVLENDGSDDVTTDDSGATAFQPLSNPIGSDLLPPGLTYVPGSWRIVTDSTSLTLDTMGVNPVFEQIDNFNNTGQTLLRWRFNGDFAPGDFVSLAFDAIIDTTSGTGMTNTFCMSAAQDFICDGTTCGTTDTTNLNNFFGTTADPNTLIAGISERCCSSTSFTVADSLPVISGDKNLLTSPPFAPTGTDLAQLGLASDTLEFEVSLSNDRMANVVLPNPVASDLLPDQLEYVAGSMQLVSNTTGLSLSTTGGNPQIDVIPDFNGTGRTLVRWQFVGDFPVDSGVTFRFKTYIKSGADGTVINAYNFNGDAPFYNCANGVSFPDTLDFDQDADLIEALCQVNAQNASIQTVASLSSTKFVKGALDTSFLQLPDTALTLVNDSVLWRLDVFNPGNVSLTEVVIVDIFPYLNDVGVQLNTTPRETGWRPYLVDTLKVPANMPNMTIYYSQQQNPCRPEISPVDGSGCVDDWSTTPPADLSTVQAIKLVLGDTLHPNMEFSMDIKMMAPDSGAIINPVAWNSLARNAKELPAQEPNKVGVRLKYFDLALYKKLAPTQAANVEPNDTVTFRIYVVNQGQIAADSIQITDYIPTDMTLVDPTWTAGTGTASRYLSVAGGDLPAGGLAPGATDSVDILLRVSGSVAANTVIQNWAEISSAKDNLFNPTFDEDSTPDANNSDTFLVDNDINGDGKNGGDEDDHDPASVTVKPFDLALYKVLAPGQASEVSPGDTVTFRIHVVNQGMIASNSISLVDYYPTGLTPVNDGVWTAGAGNSVVTTLTSGAELPANGLAAGQSTFVDVRFTVDSPLAGGLTLTNWAEISSATDDQGIAATDVDSTPDTTNSDTFLTDNDINGNGKNGGDEDDHDKAEVTTKGFDLALIKKISSTETDNLVSTGDNVTFDLFVFNQGVITADSITITDYIPTGMTLNDANWTAGAGNTAARTLTAGNELAAGGLAPGDSAVVTITVQLTGAFASNTQLINYAEISAAEDTNDNNLPDSDSTPDAINGNDLTLQDNEINGDGKNGEDEDDFDPAALIVEPFDLALVKKLNAAETDNLVSIGDNVLFDIIISNQGAITADSITITDYIPTGMTLNDANWTAGTGNTAYRTLTAGNELPAGGLAAGQIDTVTIQLQVTGSFASNTTLTNFAEISAAEDRFDNNPPDLDSTPDSDDTNDNYFTDDDISGDGKNGGDEDDHDPATVYVQPFDLALYKQLAPGQASTVEPGDTVHFRIYVTNQGMIAADSIELTDYIPTEMTLADGNWLLSGANATRLLTKNNGLPAAGLAPGETASVDIALKLGAPILANTIITNWAEISRATDASGNPQTDIDSEPDALNTDTFLVDDYIDGDGLNGGDEDDHDKAQVTVKPFDLALYKELAPGQSSQVAPGDTVTFRINIVNQGAISTNNVLLIDYFPTGLTPVNDSIWLTGVGNTVVAALMNGTGLPADGLDPGETTAVDVRFTVDAPQASGQELVNWAEILWATDTEGNFMTDVDSDPDGFNDDLYLNDNDITGDGKNGGDEDDHDRAAVTVTGFDLALYKDLAPGQNAAVEPGDDATFRIYVVNQGEIAADSIWLTDYLPTELTLNDADWTLTGSNATVLLNAGDELPVGGLVPGASAFVDITVTINSPLTSGTIIRNAAEITAAQDNLGHPQQDADSSPDADANNDNFLTDNYIDGDGKNGGDEDDHDIAELAVKPFDLALYKELAPGQSSEVAPGDLVTYRIWIVNQGMIDADSIVVTDSIPNGLTLEDALWTLNGNKATRLVNAGDELPATGLPAGASVSVDVTFRLNSPLPANMTITNQAEISAAMDNMGNPQTDFDSTPDDDFTNDTFVSDNDINGNGKLGGDEDDHDLAQITTTGFDLALWKDLAAGQSASVVPGDTVTFTIYVLNQGMIAADSIEITDYLPASLTLTDANWTAGANNTATRLLNKNDELGANGLVPGDQIAVNITAKVGAGIVGGSNIRNRAEISGATDADGNAVTDGDSQPDNDPNNDIFLQDNEVNGNGLADGDEDDHDPADLFVKGFDLALYKKLAVGQSVTVQPGDVVNYDITVINQGEIAADNIVLTDSIPTGMSLMDANWTLAGNLASRTLTSGAELPAAGLEPGQSVTIPITLQVPMSLPANTRLVNWAEISDATDLAGTPMTDVDSDPDADLGNDLYLLDNFIDGDGKNGGDEDDHDPAEVMYEVYDLAIRKSYDDPAPVAHGDTITFTITVFNQGTIAAQDIEVRDYIPAGLTYNPFIDFNGWTYDGSPKIVKKLIQNLLQPGDSVKVYLTLTVDPDVCLEDLFNAVEITSQEDEFGQNMNANDIDSSPDLDPNNDTVKDDVIVEDAFASAGMDEDDHDIEAPNIFDLALQFTTAQTFPIQIGDDVPYTIELFNQGNMKAMNTEVTVTLPTGFVLSPNNVNAWTDNGDGTVTLTWPNMIMPGDSTDFGLLLEVTPDAENGNLTATAEIESAQDMSGNVFTTEDIDSDYDTDPANDLLVDDEIHSCGIIDEDDHDIAVVELFDLALRKTPNTTEQIGWEEDVTFTITIFNQSPILAAQNIQLIDYIPAGFKLSPNDVNGWTDMGTTAVRDFKGPIAAGDSAKVEITLQVLRGTPHDTYYNTAEITYAEDGDGRDLTNYDFDSQPDSSDVNDFLTDDVIDQHGGFVPDEDEDDHDVAPVVVEIIDLALRKTTPQTDPVLYGQDVDFVLTIFNQGSRPMQNIGLADYLPAGFELSPNDTSGWTFDAITGIASNTWTGMIQPQDSAKVHILLKVKQGADPYTFMNAAEITSAQDETGADRTGDDIDSDWDTLDNNDNLTDNIITEDGRNNPGEDEDDHDVAGVRIFDLALQKVITRTEPLIIGDTITFHIRLFNQGMISAQNVAVIDSLPQGFALSAFDANGWTDNGNNTLSNTYTGVIAPQASVTIPVVLEVAATPEAGIFFNHAEITGATDTDGNVMDGFDVDSHYDTLTGNDNVVDNEINDHGTLDEDDHDLEPVEVEIVDLALRKILQLGNTQPPIQVGEDVTFALQVFNQGSVTMDTIYVVDYIPAGFILSPADGNGWTLSGAMATNKIVGPLTPNQSLSIGIVLRVDNDAHPGNITNAAEIIGSIDMNGKDRTNDDIDSQADNLNDDVVSDDEINSTPPTDEDDHDIATPPLFDLALRKTIAPTNYVTPGDTVTFTITVFNQGSMPASNIQIEDRIPTGLILSGADANGWTPVNDSLVTYTFAGPLMPGDSAKVNIDLYVTTGVTAGPHMNFSEIIAAQDGAGNDMSAFDLDSQADSDNFNDNLTNNVINENGLGDQDEDDHDVEPVQVEIIDLALRKTTNHTAPVEVGDDVIFEIEVFNQGSITMYNIGVADYYPPGFVLSPNDANGWTDNGDGSASVTLPVSIDPGNSFTIGIVLRLDNKAALGNLVNIAELTHFEDQDGADVTLDDIDSVADGDPNNDMVQDNEITGDPLVDEDDQDLASIKVNGYDFAMTKMPPAGPVMPGDTVSFDLTIYNQGTFTGYNIQITDSVPTGLILIDPNWTLTGNLATLVTPIDSLEADSVLTVGIEFMVAKSYMLDSLINQAEISHVEDAFGGPISDNDSNLDDNFSNDPVVDDEINDNGILDEDDHDIAILDIHQVFDLALWKTLAVGQANLVEPGDTVRYTIHVTNQGTLNAYNIEITDYLQPDMIFDLALNTAPNTGNAADWAADTTYTISGPVLPGDTVDVDLLVIMDSNTAAMMLTNTAEISAADNDNNPATPPIADQDSNPDDINDDFVGGNDLIHNENMDEDDHDIEPIAVMELPLGQIGGVTWFDCNENGIREPGESTFDSVLVELNGVEFDGDIVAASTYTTGGGNYLFTDLIPGDYIVTFHYPASPTGLLITLPNQGGDDDFDSDADQTTGESHRIMLFGEMISNVDAGYQDNEAPVVLSNYPELDTTIVECDMIPVFTAADVVVSDNITPDSSIVVAVDTKEVLANDCETEGFVKIIEVTWRATDGCGNTYDYISYVRVVDTTPPVVISAPMAVDTIECGQPLPTDMPVFEDSCDDNLAVAFDTSETFDGCTRIITYYWVATDDCGNSTTFSRVLYIIDTEAPVIVSAPPADLTIECDQPLPTEVPEFADNCDSTLNLTAASSIVLLDCGERIERTWTAVDGCGNQTTFAQTITIIDSTPPQITGVPDDLTVECGLIPTILFNVQATDNCDPNVVLTDTIITTGNDPCVGYDVIHIWTAVDSCGNMSRDTMIMRVQDTLAPELSNVPDDVTIECGTTPPVFASPDVFDACDQNVTVQLEVEETGNTICGSILLYKWTATDACGNTVTDTTVVNLQDQTAPVLTGVPADFMLSCDDECPPPPQITVTDNCDNDPTILFVEEIEGDTTSCEWRKVWKWKVFDHCDNLTEATTIITFKDTTGPAITPVHPDLVGLMDGDTIMVECDNVPIPDANDVTATDNCSEVVDITLSETVHNADCLQDGYLYILTCTWTATDACGNEGTWTIYVKVRDTHPPVLTGPIQNMTVECDMVPDTAMVTVTDNCDNNPTVIFDEQRIDGNCADSYTLNRFWTVSDECGNDTTYTQTIQVVDSTPPVFANVPADLTINCDEVIPNDMPTASDNCDDQVEVTFDEITQPGNCPQEMTLTRTWTATDNCGNVATAQQIITVEDNDAPVFTTFPADVTIECDAVVPTDAPTANDNCDQTPAITMTETEVPGICPQEKVIMRDWTATDDCGNAITQTQRITIQDNTPPVFVMVPADITVECDQVPTSTGTPVVEDNCDPDVELTMTDVITDGDCENAYTIKRSWLATDACGNATMAMQTITVEDNTPPVFVNPPADITVACDNIPPLEPCVATDNCDDDVFTFSDEEILGASSTQNGCSYEIKRSWKAVDNCGNFTEHIQIVTVTDDEAPVITPTHPLLAGLMNGDTLTLECQDLPVLDTSDVDVSDNCCTDIQVEFVELIAPGDCLTDGYFMLMRCGWVATDCCGNEASFMVYFKVIDVTDPVLTGIPDDVTVECDQIPTPPTVTAMDNCDNHVDIELSESTVPGNCADEYTLIRTWTATDNCGNTATASQTITVRDTTAPVFANVPADVTIECDQPLPTDAPTATDNCAADVEITFDEVTTSGCPFTITRTWTAIDNCGNTTAVTQVITVEDHTPPVVDVPADLTLECGDLIPNGQADISDNCDDDLDIQMTETTEPLACGEKITRTWTVTDHCGNVTTGVQMITLTDMTPPAFVNTPADLTVACDQIPAPEDCVATDNCDDNVATTFAELVDDANPCEIKIKRIWTATDACGNTNSVEQIITAIDNEGPVITPTHPALAGVMSGDTLMMACNASTVFGADDVLVEDNCSDATYEFVELVTDVGNCADDGYLFIIKCCWKAEDDCGNLSEYCIYVKITDDTPPMLMDVPADITVECQDIPDPNMNVMAMDECDDDVTVTFSEFIESGDCNGQFTIRREWTATDHCGNTTVGVQLVHVEDNTAPIILGVAGDITVECDQIPAPDDVKAVDNCDNNPVLEMEEVTSSGDCPYTITRSWTATDDCGNMSQMVQVITVNDTTAPTLAGVPDDAQYQCVLDVPVPPTVTATDNCDDDVTVTFDEQTDGDICDQTITRTWTATDNCGNTATETQVITVQDDIAPTLTGVPDDIIVSCDEIPDVAQVSASDNCAPDVTITFEETTSPDSCDYQIYRTWTATDDCGNMATGTQVITVTDDEAPVFLNPPADITVDCSEIPVVTDCPATDNCDDNLQYQFVELVGAGSCAFEIKRIWTATDDCGNMATTEQIITVIDETGPTLTFTNPLLQGLQDGDELVLDCNNLEFFDETDATATDECDDQVEIMFMEGTPVIGDCATDGFTTEIVCTWIAKDDCGNQTSITLTIKVADTTAPVISGIPADVTIGCDDDMPPVATPSADDCSDVTFEMTETTDVNGCATIVTRTWTATDACGNVSTATQVITRTDTGAPVFASVPADVTIACSEALPTDEPEVSDDCGNVTLTSEDATTPGNCPQEMTIVRTWTATDECGNVSTATQVITIQDTTAPTLSGVPSDLTVNADNGETVPAPPTVTADDNCDPDITVDFTENEDPGQCEIIIVRTWTATDACGNVATESQTITVIMNNLGVQVTDLVPESCDGNDGQAVLAPQNLTYTWSDGGTGFTRTDLAAGTYTVIATNADGCANTLTITIDNNCNCIEPVVNQIVLTATSCGDDNGAALLNVAGDPDVYQYTWAPDLGTPLNGHGYERGNLPAGDYSVTIADPQVAGCQTIATFTIEPSDPVVTDVVTTPASCAGNDGSVTITPANYTYNWSDGFIGNARTDLAPGTWQVTLTTPENCTEVLSVLVDSDCDCIEPVVEDITLVHTMCGTDSGSAIIELTGDESLYNFDWIPNLGTTLGANDNSRTDLPAGDYLVIITFGNNDTCETKAEFTILPSDPVVFSVEENNPETCAGNDGSVTLAPDSLIFNWNDGFTGAVRTGLTAGTYSVTAINSLGCFETLDVTVENNGLMNVQITTNTNADCNTENGHVVLDPAAYDYAWSDGGTGHERNDLAAGTYTVTATSAVPGCSGIVTVIVDENPCTDCPIWFYMDTAFVELPATDTAVLCIPVPYMIINDFDIFVDGNDYTLPLDSCNSSNVVFYTYALIVNNNWNGPYGVEWAYNGSVYTDTVATIAELVQFMNAVDATGFWMQDAASVSLVGGDINATYGDLNILDLTTQQSGVLQVNTTVLPLGTQLQFPGIGTFELVVQDQEGCSDTLIVVVEDNITPLPRDFIAADFMAASSNCDDGIPTICVEIPYDELSNYAITNNGVPFSGTMEACNFEANYYYNYINLPGLGNDGPYVLNEWTFNGNVFSANFDNIGQLVDLMNQWDPTGNWSLDPVGFNLVGGNPVNNYGAMNIGHLQSGAVNVIQLNSNVIPNATAFTLEPGMNELIITRLSDGAADTLMAAIACVTSEYLYNEIVITQQDTICMDTDELMGQVTQMFNICEDQSGAAAEFDLIPGTNCIECVGMTEGSSEACIVLCDEYGICDTTFLAVNVRALDEPTSKRDTMHTTLNRSVVGDIIANDNLPDDLTSFRITRQPENGIVTINPDNTVTYEPFEDYCNTFEGGEPDFFLYEVCTAGGCSTGVVYVYVDCGELIFYSGFSPNGDGINDFFRIDGLGKYPNNKLCVFNRWGAKVYCTDNYQNDWGGTWNTNDLPDGTYFYIFETADGKRHTGYVQITR